MHALPDSDARTADNVLPVRVDVTEYGLRRAAVTIAVIMGALLEIIDTTIVNVALPYIQGNIGASQEEGTFIVTGYIVANVVVIPLSPWLQRRLGRKQYFFASVAVFTVASIFCGLSHDLLTLVFWRIVQGAGGGGLLSQAQAILGETFPPKQQSAAQGIFAIGAIVGPTIGPVLGGLISDNVSWQWCFFVNVPVGIAAGVLTLLYVRNPEEPESLPIDAVGLALLATGLGAMQYVLDQGQEKDWFSDSLIARLAVVSATSLVAFVLWELYGAKRPIVDLRILRYRTVWAGSLLGLCLGVTLLGTLVTLPQYAQGPLGFTATLSGELILFRALPVMFLTPLGARLAASGKIDPRVQIGVGFALMALSNWQLASVTTSTATFWTFFFPLAISGIGLSQVFVPLSLVVFGSVAPPEIPKVSAMFNLARQLGGSLATALLVTALDRSTVANQTRLAANVTLSNASTVAYLDANGGTSAPAALGALNQIVSGQATVLGYADTDRDAAIVTLMFTPLAFLLRRPKDTTGIAIE